MRILITTIALTAAAAPALAQAPDPTLARNLAATCANCHGTDGHSAGGIPPLAGLEPALFLERMSSFKSGRRASTVMNQIAKGFTDEQIAELARYFARQKP